MDVFNHGPLICGTAMLSIEPPVVISLQCWRNNDGALEGPHFLAQTKRAGKGTLIFIFEKIVYLSQKPFV